MDEQPVNGKAINRFATERGYNGKCVFITGGTGFVGKVLVEKLLRTCPKVKAIYMLVKSKRGKSPQERLDEMFAGPLYDLLRKTHGDDIVKKAIAVPGDLTAPDMGLSQEHRRLIAENVCVIYHLAAVIRFDLSLSQAVLLNVRGTKLMLEYAKEFKRLGVFCHVSTAFCHLKEKVLYEKAYPPPADPNTIIGMIEHMDEDFVTSIQHKILNDYPNCYSFTKALGEALVVQEMDNLPVIVLRPSLLIPIWKEPLPGWADNINGPLGLLIGAGKGVIRTMHLDDKAYADMMPVDIAVNALILSTGDYVQHKGVRRFYNLTTSHEFKITWVEIIELGRYIVTHKMPFNGVMWYPGGSVKKSKIVHIICVVLFHYIPAIVLDAFIYLSGNKPVLWRVQRRVSKGFDVFNYYVNNQWEFNNEGTLKALSLMNEEEKRVYKLDSSGLDLEEFLINGIHCSRLYILKESDDTIPAARRHLNRMWYVDKISKFLLMIGFIYILMHYLFYATWD